MSHVDPGSTEVSVGARWWVIGASARGVHHERAGTPNEDAWCDGRNAGGAVAAAVADGHGHSRHFRSHRGSALAADVARTAALSLASRVPDDVTSEVLHSALFRHLAPRIWRRWTAAVAADVARDPFTDAEHAWRREGDEPVFAYGSTLLLACALGRWVLLGRIGDGDILAVTRSGKVLVPLPAAGGMAGEQTNSLVQPDAVGAFRFAVLDHEAEPLALLLLATDGYGNAQAEERWEPKVGVDLLAMLDTRGRGWVAEQLPTWAARCASVEGSGDDVTIALLVMGD